jgi:hypothetical protein
MRSQDTSGRRIARGLRTRCPLSFRLPGFQIEFGTMEGADDTAAARRLLAHHAALDRQAEVRALIAHGVDVTCMSTNCVAAARRSQSEAAATHCGQLLDACVTSPPLGCHLWAATSCPASAQ